MNVVKKIFLLLALILLTTANVEAAEQSDLPFEPLATTYVEGEPHEMLALIKMKSDNSLYFMATAKGISSIGLAVYRRETYDFYLHEAPTGYPPLIFGMILPEQERGQLDDDFGAWEENVHLLPVYALFDVKDGQIICDKPFYSASGLNPSHYQGTIQNPEFTRLIEIFMTHMPRLHEAVTAQNITLP